MAVFVICHLAGLGLCAVYFAALYRSKSFRKKQIGKQPILVMILCGLTMYSVVSLIPVPTGTDVFCEISEDEEKEENDHSTLSCKDENSERPREQRCYAQAPIQTTPGARPRTRFTLVRRRSTFSSFIAISEPPRKNSRKSSDIGGR